MEQMKNLAREAVAYAKGKCDYADILIEKSLKAEYKALEDGSEMVLPYSSRAAMQIRLSSKDGKHVEASTGISGIASIKKAIDTAAKILSKETSDRNYGLAKIEKKEGDYITKISQDIRDGNTILELRQIAKKAIAEAKKSEKNGIKITAEIWTYMQIEEKAISDTEGMLKFQKLPQTFFQIKVKAKKANKMSQYRTRFGDIKEISLVPLKTILSKSKEAAEKAIELLDARALTPEEMSKVTHFILKPDTMVFVHEAEGHNFESDIIKVGGSGLFDAKAKILAEPLASEMVDIFDGPPIENRNFDFSSGFGTQAIDDEGIEVEPVKLVENGKIIGKMHNRETANYYKEKPNGHGFSELGNPRIVRMTNTYIVPSKKAKIFKDLNEMASKVKFGILLEGSSGGQVSKDGMATGIQIGYLIKNGRLTKEALLPSNFAVKTKGALLGVEGFVGKTEIPDCGFCGKGQMKTVSDGGPLTLMRNTEALSLRFT